MELWGGIPVSIVSVVSDVSVGTVVSNVSIGTLVSVVSDVSGVSVLKKSTCERSIRAVRYH